MQGKGLIKFFLVVLVLVCVYQFALIIPTRNIEKRADSYAAQVCSASDAADKTFCLREGASRYLDSLSGETVLNLGFTKFTYQELKKQQLALGLDLKGGMSVVMQIDLKDLIVVLSGDSKDEKFREALAEATKRQANSQLDYVTLFKQSYETVAEGQQLAPIFANNAALRDDINFETTNSEVAAIIRKQADETVQLTFNRLKQRIDKFGVAQPTVTLDNTTDRIIVELPGVSNPKRARKLLQATAKLEFFEVFNIDEIFNQLNTADQRLKTKSDATTALDSATTVIDSTTIDAELDTTGVDSLDDIVNQNSGPLLKLLRPNFALGNGQYGYGTGAIVGLADVRDTAEVNKLLASPEMGMPRNLRFYWSAKASNSEGDVEDFELYALKIPANNIAPLEGDKITDAKADIDPQRNVYVVSLDMNREGARSWGRLTQEAYNAGNKAIAIVLDNEVVSAPSVINPIKDGSSQITGNFTPQEAQDLANILQVGKLPAKTKIIEENIVGPSLGADNINRSLQSMFIGLSLVLIFMILYYGSGGIVSIIALLANLFFILGSLASLGTVLTLPGIAGIILTIGMAVDANVIIYERIREELRDGKSTLMAIKDGFKHSYSAIVDANVTTILTAIVLSYFGLGPIKGFAIVLIIGVLSSLFTAVLVGRLIIDWWTSKERDIAFSTKMSESAFANLGIDFVGARKKAYVISGTLITAGLISFFARGFELGVDFKGGYSYAVQFEDNVNASQIRSGLTDYLGGTPTVKTFGGNNTYEITTSYLINSTDEDADAQVLAKLYEGVSNIVGAEKMQGIEAFAGTSDDGTVSATHLTRSIKVGPTIADDIRQSAFYSAIFALLLIFLYIFIRFRKWQYSMGAVAALFHDVLVVLSIFSLLHGILPFPLEIDQAFIAAILTVIGYSINDTVVVFDRIREYMNVYLKKNKTDVINLAVNNTISRTIITSLTTLFVILMLFLFGSGSIKGFAFALLVGVIVGTYSSVFVATPIVHDLTGDEVQAKETGEKTKYGRKKS